MVLKRRAGIVAAFAVSLVLLGIFAAAQVVPQPPIKDRFQPPLTTPTVIAGNDLGFRVESTRNGIPVGKLVVRINEKWVDAELGGAAIVPAAGK